MSDSPAPMHGTAPNKRSALYPLNLDPMTASPVLLRMAFRPFFLLAGSWAVLAISLWLAQLGGLWHGNQLLPATLWHGHEMLFGFGALVAAGFLLTAAQNWTARQGLQGRLLLLSCLLWLSARLLALFATGNVGFWCLLACQFGWWLCVLWALAQQLIPAQSRNNYVFLPLLTLMALLNISVLLLANQQPLLAGLLCQSMVLLFCLLMGIVGGRVIPFFTARTTQTAQPKTPKLDRALFWLTCVGIAVFISNSLLLVLADAANAIVLALRVSGATLLVGTGVLHLFRLGVWSNWQLRRHPLLWSLHGAYLAMALGILLLGLLLLHHAGVDAMLAAGFIDVPALLPNALTLQKDMLHLLAISAMAGMMLAMMARVSLGHTGRPLEAKPLMSLAFAAVLVAGLVRSVATVTPTLLADALSPTTFQLWLVSGLLWLGAFALFVRCYWPVLTQARLDGKPG